MPRYDVVIVGAGPAGSTAALCLAGAGARVALVDRRAFPRDKACGDLIGPRGLAALDQLGVTRPSTTRPVGEMVVVGPSGRRTVLPAFAGLDYPDHGFAMRREDFDDMLFQAAVRAGAHPIQGRVCDLIGGLPTVAGVRLRSGERLVADAVIGADGALSRIADAAALVDAERTLWGFALRTYVGEPVDLPHILLWEPRPWRLFPGYGWVFPTDDGRANVGLGIGVAAHRDGAAAANRQFDEFLAYLAALGLIGTTGATSRIGGWLKMGQIGTVPARGNVLLVGDAAGLVNPLQGEGIAQAIISGHAAALAILAAGPRGAAGHYRAALRKTTTHHRVNAPVQAAIVRHPITVSLFGRVLTAPVVRGALAGGWSLYWNDLVRGAQPSAHRTLARAAARVSTAASRRGEMNAWFAQST